MCSPRPASQKMVNVEDQSIRITTYSSWAQLEETMPAWEDILEENPALSIFSTPEWLGSWWKAFGLNRQMVTLAFSTGSGELLGLAPLYLDDCQLPLFGRLKRLRLVGDGSGDSDNLDFIVKPEHHKACAAALVEWLRTGSDWQLCELNTLPSDSVAGSELVQVLKASRWEFSVSEQPRLTIDLPDTWDTYLARLSNKERSKIRYYSRRLARKYNVRSFKCASTEDLSPCLEILFGLHQKRWQIRSEWGSFASAARREFYSQMGRSFLERKWLELWLLELNGKPVAAQFGFRYRDTVYALQEGFDPDYAADCVGYVLRSYVLENLISEGVRRYDFLAGQAQNPSKERWGARPSTYLNLRFASPGTFGSYYLIFDKLATKSKEWLRHRLPSRAWIALHRLKMKRDREAVSAKSVTVE